VRSQVGTNEADGGVEKTQANRNTALVALHPNSHIQSAAATCRQFHRLMSAAWHHGSVVRTSVSGWRTFPDLCLIYG